MKTLSVVVLLSALVVTAAAWGVEPVDRVIVRPRVLVGPAEEPMLGPPPLEPLGRPLRLEFRIEPDGEEGAAVELLAATAGYRAEMSSAADESEFEFSVRGRLRIVRPDQILVTYELVAAVRTPDGAHRVSLEGSAIIKSGEQKTVATFGDRSLVIKATFEEE